MNKEEFDIVISELKALDLINSNRDTNHLNISDFYLLKIEYDEDTAKELLDICDFKLVSPYFGNNYIICLEDKEEFKKLFRLKDTNFNKKLNALVQWYEKDKIIEIY